MGKPIVDRGTVLRFTVIQFHPEQSELQVQNLSLVFYSESASENSMHVSSLVDTVLRAFDMNYRAESTVSRKPKYKYLFLYRKRSSKRKFVRNHEHSRNIRSHTSHLTREYCKNVSFLSKSISLSIYGFSVHSRLSVKCCGDVYTFWTSVVRTLERKVDFATGHYQSHIHNYKMFLIIARPYLAVGKLAAVCNDCCRRIMSHTLITAVISHTRVKPNCMRKLVTITTYA